MLIMQEFIVALPWPYFFLSVDGFFNRLATTFIIIAAFYLFKMVVQNNLILLGMHEIVLR